MIDFRNMAEVGGVVGMWIDLLKVDADVEFCRRLHLIQPLLLVTAALPRHDPQHGHQQHEQPDQHGAGRACSFRLRRQDTI